MDAEISALAKVISIRCAWIAMEKVSSGEVTVFGNGAHLILPKEHIGKTIRYQVED
jgi:putative transposon-encoded protein